MRVCEVDGCGVRHYAKGWCKSHYRRLAVAECKEADCHEPADARGWCRKHYMRWQQHGDAQTVLGRRPKSSNPNLRWCNGCKKFHPVAEFGIWLDKRGGKTVERYQASCKIWQRANRKQHRDEERRVDPGGQKARNRESNIKRLYGITPQQYDELLMAQGGVCAICGNGCSTYPNLSVDHDHKTGAIRGLLCNTCNRFMGMASDDPAILQAAIDYLQHHAARLTAP